MKKVYGKQSVNKRKRLLQNNWNNVAPMQWNSEQQLIGEI